MQKFHQNIISYSNCQ